MSVYYLTIMIVFFGFSCGIKKSTSFSYKDHDGDIKLPLISYLVTHKIMSSDNEYIQEYIYPYSSIFYLTSFGNTYNYDLIRDQETYYKRFQALETIDTLTLRGQNSEGLFWKDKLLETGITIGYTKLPKSKLVAFDTYVESVRRIN